MKKNKFCVSLDSIKLSDNVKLVEFHKDVYGQLCCYLEFNSMIIGEVAVVHNFADIFKIGDCK